MGSGIQAFTDVFVGTGADLDVEKIGFRPRVVILVNMTDPGLSIWIEGMADDAMFKQVDGTATAVSSNGITIPADGEGTGFTLGADADMNVASEVLHVVAFR